MFKVEVTYGSDPIAQAALNRRVHDRLIEEVFNGRNREVLDEILHPDVVNHHELFPTGARWRLSDDLTMMRQLGLLPELAATKAAK